MADKTFHHLFSNPGFYADPPRPYADTVADWINAGAGDAAKDLAFALTEVAPSSLAFTLDDDPGFIHLGHSPFLLRPVPGAADPTIDDLACLLLGDALDSVVPFVLPDNIFTTLAANVRVHDAVADHLAALQASAGGFLTPLAAATPNTSVVGTRRCMVLPSEFSATIVDNAHYRISALDFYNVYLQPLVGTPDEADYAPLFLWWIIASTQSTAMVAGVATDRIAISRECRQPPVHQFPVLQARSRRAAIRMLAPIPGGGPALGTVTTAVGNVTTAVTEVRDQLVLAETARQTEAARRAAPVTFGDRFGASVLALVQRFTRAATEADLPEIHRVMASYDKRSRDTTTLNLAIASAANGLASINETNLPKTTPYLLNLFRTHDLIGNGFELGEGLNPFSVICLGHPNTKDVLQVAERQASVEAGSSVSLADATQFKSKDGRFPKSYIQATDKLWGFVLICCIYLGEAHPLCVALLDSVSLVAPMLQQLESLFSSNPRQGMLISIKVLLLYQHLVQRWLRRARDSPVGAPVAGLDFDKVEDAMRMQSYDSLPRVPDTWMEALKAQLPSVFQPNTDRLRGGGGSNTRDAATPSTSSNVATNSNPDSGLLARWAASGLRTVADLKTHWTGSGEYTFPKVNGKEICLKNQLTGKCKTGCKHAASHGPPSSAVVTALNGHLDLCGVARA